MSKAQTVPSIAVDPTVAAAAAQFLSPVVHGLLAVDTAAERIVALGLPIDARVQNVAEKAGRTAVPAGFEQSDELIRAVIGDIDAILVDVKAAVDGLDEVDLTSQDVAIEIQRGLEKDRWFLISHIAA